MIGKLIVVLLSLSFARFIEKTTGQLLPQQLQQALTFLAANPLNNNCSRIETAADFTNIVGFAYFYSWTSAAVKCGTINIQALNNKVLPQDAAMRSAYSFYAADDTALINKQTSSPSTLVVQPSKHGEAVALADINISGPPAIIRTTDIIAWIPGAGYALAACTQSGMSVAIFLKQRPNGYSGQSNHVNELQRQIISSKIVTDIRTLKIIEQGPKCDGRYTDPLATSLI